MQALDVHWIETAGQKTPEYTVLLQSLGEISEKIEAEKDEFSRDLLSANVIPSLKSIATKDLMTVVLDEVGGNPLKFYALLQVLDQRNHGERYSSVLERLRGRFLGNGTPWGSALCNLVEGGISSPSILRKLDGDGMISPFIEQNMNYTTTCPALCSS